MGDMSDVGHDKKFKTPIEKVEAEQGTYKEKGGEAGIEEKTAYANLPKHQQETPFKIGPLGSSSDE